MQVFMQDLARGAFTYAPPTVGQLSRAIEVDRRFADLGLGLVDGSVVALAESLGIRRLATRDVPTSPPFGSATVARSSWWFIRRIPTLRDSRERYGRYWKCPQVIAAIRRCQHNSPYCRLSRVCKSSIRNGEMLERSIRHAWKAIRASCTERYQNTSSRNQLNEFPRQHTSRYNPVSADVCRPFQGHLTQFLHSSERHFLALRRDVPRQVSRDDSGVV